MNVNEIYRAIDSGSASERDQALLSLLKQVETLTTAVLELAGARELETGVDALSARSRVLLEDFVEVGESGKGKHAL